MANELTHKDPGTELTQAEFIASDGTGHVFESQATGDIAYASSATVLSRLAKATDGNVLELASGLPAWTASPTIGATNWGNAGHAHAASNSGGTIAITSTTGTLAVGNGGTGITSLATGVATFLGTSSSANLRAALTDETGTGEAVFATSPTLVTPALGTPSALVATNASGTAANLTAGTVTTNANLTGDVTSSGNAATLVLSNLTGAAINVAADSIPFLDADGSATRIESIADLATAMAGTNLTASSGQLVAGAAGAGLGLVIALS